MAIRCLVYGGRKYGLPKSEAPTPQDVTEARWERAALRSILDDLLAEHGKLVIIQGDATGADAIGKKWAEDNGQECLPFPANWDDLSHADAVIKVTKAGKKYDALAGHRRNQRMIDEGKPDLAVATPGGPGTSDMTRRLDMAGINIVRVES
jgi:hypothetical protein